ncbi:hypothetical protein [Nitrosomonas sp.]|uniref:hypothetical protein n=1 Tax=Nitrosomonas sp. TaxID=42353 RepID=UPI00260A9C14|nr:hypothetical protein [Nitrosomonas sp.]MCW5601361.1 hypothetical protein [Nitrosomonas sp.]
MANKKIPGKKVTTKKSRSKTDSLIGKPDISVLARYSPTDEANSHPDWVKEQFPTYVGPHTGHEATAVREFMHEGHAVKIITSYRVEVDGQPVRAHLSVDEDGQVYTHATPFVTYASAVDLMKTLINAYPDSFSSNDIGHEKHHNHSHHGEKK